MKFIVPPSFLETNEENLVRIDIGDSSNSNLHLHGVGLNGTVENTQSRSLAHDHLFSL